MGLQVFYPKEIAAICCGLIIAAMGSNHSDEWLHGFVAAMITVMTSFDLDVEEQLRNRKVLRVMARRGIKWPL